MANYIERHATEADELQEVAAPATSAGAGDAGKLAALNGQGQWDQSFFPSGIGTATFIRTASEALSAGDYVNIWNDGGTAKARKADRTNGRRAHAFVLANVALDDPATCYPPGESNTSLSGLTVGAKYVLGAAGAVEDFSTATITAGHLSQYIGDATAADTILSEIGTAIETAS